MSFYHDKQWLEAGPGARLPRQDEGTDGLGNNEIHALDSSSDGTEGSNGSSPVREVALLAYLQCIRGHQVHHTSAAVQSAAVQKGVKLG